MNLSEHQIKLVKQSWLKLRGIDPKTIADLFYTKLFTDTPSLRKMFPTDMQQQYVKLMDMLSAIVVRLENIHEMDNVITEMGDRHTKEYGVKNAHYDAVGSALIWTLQKGLGAHWNDELAEAWITCYQIIAHTMMHHEKK